MYVYECSVSLLAHLHSGWVNGRVDGWMAMLMHNLCMCVCMTETITIMIAICVRARSEGIVGNLCMYACRHE